MSKRSTNINFSKILYRCFILIIFGMVMVFTFVLYLSKNLPSLEQLENYDPDLVTRIYSSDGIVLNELHPSERRRIDCRIL